MNDSEGVKEVFRSLVQYSEAWNWIPTVISMVINLFHVFILSKKSIPSNSVHCILLGIGVVDILSPMIYIKMAVNRLAEEPTW
uniref:G_PROTEIN_RECEP_F1_2 domain-containing protein n=1 Tax=Caenorhabditis tropicalis TaxID=1561998 RepID=A0A1I7T2T1_9PELO